MNNSQQQLQEQQITAELELEIQREIELEREDQFVLEQIELDHKQHWSGDKKA
jgi:hypothetical protein